MGVFQIVLMSILLLVSLALIVLVLMQSGKSAGLTGAIAGGAETFFGKQKARSYEGKLAFFTKIAVAIFVVLAIVLVLIQ